MFLLEQFMVERIEFVSHRNIQCENISFIYFLFDMPLLLIQNGIFFYYSVFK